MLHLVACKSCNSEQFSPTQGLRMAAKLASQLFQAEAGEALTLGHFVVLLALSQHGSVTQRALADLTGIDASTLTAMVRGMVSKSLVDSERTKSDRRVSHISATDHGLALLRETMPRMRNAERKLLQALPPERQKAFLDALEEIAQTLPRLTTNQGKPAGCDCTDAG